MEFQSNRSLPKTCWRCYKRGKLIIMAKKDCFSVYQTYKELNPVDHPKNRIPAVKHGDGSITLNVTPGLLVGSWSDAFPCPSRVVVLLYSLHFLHNRYNHWCRFMSLPCKQTLIIFSEIGSRTSFNSFLVFKRSAPELRRSAPEPFRSSRIYNNSPSLAFEYFRITGHFV